MMSIRKIFMVSVLAVPMLFVPAPRTEATITGDALLYAQQVLQYTQDFKQWYADAEERASKYKELATFAKNITYRAKELTQGYQSVTNILNTSKQLFNTSQYLESFVGFVGDYSVREDLVQDADNVFKYFGKVGNQYCSSTQTLLKSFDGMSDLKPNEWLTFLDEITNNLYQEIALRREESMTMMMDICDQVVVDNTVLSNQSFINSNLI